MRRGSMGNPHCVIQVDDVDTAAVERLVLFWKATSVFRSEPISVYASG